MSEKKKVVLAFSGGLDTSFCVKYLSEDKGYEVHSVLVDTGGFSDEELKAIEARAYSLGVKSHVTISKTAAYYDECIKYLIFGNILKNSVFFRRLQPLSLPKKLAQRPLPTEAQAQETTKCVSIWRSASSCPKPKSLPRFVTCVSHVRPKSST
jgi:NH3-dependent NAD+ synthetase